MTDLERAETKFQRQIDFQNARIDKIDVKLDAFIQEMRDRDNQRAAEIKDIRTEMRDRDNQRIAENQAIRAEMSEIRTSLQNIQTSGRNLNIVTLLGIAAMVVAILLR